MYDLLFIGAIVVTIGMDELEGIVDELEGIVDELVGIVDELEGIMEELEGIMVELEGIMEEVDGFMVEVAEIPSVGWELVKVASCSESGVVPVETEK